MKAFIEWIWCPCGIVRVGRDTDEYGKPYDYAVVAVLTWRNVFRWLRRKTPVDVVIKALVAPEAQPLSQTHARTILGTLKKAGFRGVWERFKVKDEVDSSHIS